MDRASVRKIIFFEEEILRLSFQLLPINLFIVVENRIGRCVNRSNMLYPIDEAQERIVR